MKREKVGRNDPCVCGSGKKFKKCCEASARVSPTPAPLRIAPFSVRELRQDQVPPDVLRLAAQGIAGQFGVPQPSRYGQVRPEIAFEFHGYRFVAIGGKLIYMPANRCNFLSDVLIAYVPQLFRKEWFDQEIAKPRDERHPAMQWRVKGMNYMTSQPKLPDGTYAVQFTGPLMAYMTFAYDLYVVDHNSRLDQRLIERLKRADQFQGARHELFAEATCLRAGFEIAHEDESDRSTRHAEFTATHKATGVKVSVEAKSKHRAGVLGQPGQREPEDSLNLRFGKLLNLAIAKSTPHPFVVFLDMNMPFQAAQRLLAPRSPIPTHPLIHGTLDRIRAEHNGKDPINLLLITNQPQHYTKDGELAQRAHWLAQVSQVPVKPARIDVLFAIAQAANLYGNIPNELPKDGLHRPTNTETATERFQEILASPTKRAGKAS